MILKSVFALFVLSSACAPILHSQVLEGDYLRKRTTPSKTFFGLGFVVAQPIGEFDRQIDVGGGIEAHVIHQLGRRSPVALRAGLGYIVYGHESRRFQPFPRIEARLNTDNSIFFAGVGPQLMVPSGRFRPYLAGSVGLSYFSTNSSVQGRNAESENLFNTTNFDDATFAYTGTGGLYIPVKKGLRPISIDLGVRYHGNGNAEYLREGSITDNGDNTISFTPIKSQANLVTYHIGVAIGL